MKDLGKTRYCLELQIKHRLNGNFIHQSLYTEKILKYFYMDKYYPLSTPKEDNEQILSLDVSYLNVISDLII